MSGQSSYREPSPTKSLKPLYLLTTLFNTQLPSGRLIAADVGLADEGCKLLEQTVTNVQPGLITIDLRGNRVTSPGLSALVRVFRKCPALEHIALNWNDLENDNLGGMADLENYLNDGLASRVRHLDLRNSNLSLDSKDYIEGIIRSAHLRYIDLSWNNFNDGILTSILQAISSRQSVIQLEIKGAGISNPALSQISAALAALGNRFPAPNAIEMKFSSEELIKDLDGKKRLILDNLYHSNQERVIKMSHDSARTILNPDTAELEILMAEMLKKKIYAKDKLLRDVDDKIKSLHDMDTHIQELAVKRDQAVNENMALRREFESLKTLYSKTKQSNIVELESLASQFNSLSENRNRRDIEHRAAIDKLLFEQKSRARAFADQLEAKEAHLVEKIKMLSLDRERMDKQLTDVKCRLTLLLSTSEQKVKSRTEQLKQEECARAEWNNRLLESRTLCVREGAEMSQRRGIDHLKGQTAAEEAIMLRIKNLQEQIATKRSVESSLKEAVRSVEVATDRLVEEDITVETNNRKLQDKIKDAADDIQRRKDKMENSLIEAEDRVYGIEGDIKRQRDGMELKLSELESVLRRVRVEIDTIDSKREFLLDNVHRNVHRTIYDTLIRQSEKN
jgi:Leucine Rich repeat